MNFRQPTWWRASLVWMKSSYGDLERLPDFPELAGHVVDVGLRLDAQFLARCETLIVFSSLPIRKWTAAPFHPAKPSLNIGADLLERRADMRPAVGIINRRRNVKSRRVSHRVVPILVPRPAWKLTRCDPADRRPHAGHRSRGRGSCSPSSWRPASLPERSCPDRTKFPSGNHDATTIDQVRSGAPCSRSASRRAPHRSWSGPGSVSQAPAPQPARHFAPVEGAVETV